MLFVNSVNSAFSGRVSVFQKRSQIFIKTQIAIFSNFKFDNFFEDFPLENYLKRKMVTLYEFIQRSIKNYFTEVSRFAEFMKSKTADFIHPYYNVSNSN